MMCVHEHQCEIESAVDVEMGMGYVYHRALQAKTMFENCARMVALMTFNIVMIQGRILS